MTSFEQALELILGAVQPLESEEVNILDSIGRVTAQEIIAPFGLPLFDNSAMDGYAVRAEECNHWHSMSVEGFIPAGAEAWPHLEAGKAVRIMTGAPIPKNADTVVPLEEATEDERGRIRIVAEVKPGQHVRCAGEDIKEGDTVIHSGTPIGVPEVNILAAMGSTSIHVHRKPVVAILSTGDELVELGGTLSRGKIYDSNSLVLAAAVKDAGATPRMLGIARDNCESLRQKLAEASEADALITTAGVSVGDRDLVREVLAELGGNEVFWGVKMKPGKATAFAVLAGKPVFSLPGNPVSVMVTFEKLVRPALLRMGGMRAVVKQSSTAVLQEPMHKKAGRIFFARVKLKLVDGKLLAWSAGPQDTGYQRPMLNADAIALLPAERSLFNTGEEINVHLLSSHFGMAEPTLA